MSESEGENFARAVSLLLGWSYFLAWSISFWPQVIYNIKRRATFGLAVDFTVANILGMSAYTTYTAALAFSPEIRREYALRHVDSPTPSVRVNDFVYGLHGATIVIIMYTQFWPRVWGFKVGVEQKASMMMLCICGACLLAVMSGVFIVLVNDRHSTQPAANWMWLDVIYLIGNVKVFMTIIKYTPQVWVIYKRKSTEGFRMEAIFLDLAGAIMSIFQLCIDASLANDWASVTGNPAKFALGNVTILFDILFLLQHYVWYGPTSIQRVEIIPGYDEERPLLSGSS